MQTWKLDHPIVLQDGFSSKLLRENIHIQWNIMSNIWKIKNYLTSWNKIWMYRILAIFTIIVEIVSQKIELTYQLPLSSSNLITLR